MTKIVALILSLSALLAGSTAAPSAYIELGIPTAEKYTTGSRARGVWDMAYMDEKLYIGSGDFDSNAGPVDIWCFDTVEGEWSNSGTVEDEEVNRFINIGSTLAVPGTDPRSNTGYGNYYKLNDGVWESMGKIPDAVHTFDLLEHDGKIFAGLGVDAGKYPIAVSSDGGVSFKPVKMRRDGKLVDTSVGAVVRVYDLFCLKDTVYAVFRYRVGDKKSFDLYRYNGSEFVFDNEWYDKLEVIKYVSGFIGGDAVYKDRLWFTTGNLYMTDDMEQLNKVVLDADTGVYDVYADESGIYALGCKSLSNGRYRISVWENTSGEADGFTQVKYFFYDAPAVSLIRAEGYFVIGTGDIDAINDKSGAVIAIEE